MCTVQYLDSYCKVKSSQLNLHTVEPGAEGAEITAAELKSQLASAEADLRHARQETSALRRELMDALALLQQPRNIHTQTTPRPTEDPSRQAAESLIERERDEIRRQRTEIEAQRAVVVAQRRQLEEEQRKRVDRTATVATQAGGGAPAGRSRSQSSPIGQAEAAGVETGASSEEQHVACRQEAGRLRDKISYLEKQLDTTENSLRTNQNLASENSARTYELNSQLVQLKMALNEANRTVDEQRLKLDKKEELVRKIVDDKNELLER